MNRGSRSSTSGGTNQPDPEDSKWRPTCDIEVLRLRAAMLTSIRQFFSEQNYLEVETPLLSHDIVVDAHLMPFEVPGGCDGRPMFLQTSPEAGMKRLLAAGSGSIFQITRSFRRDELGTRHNPEFTMVEWYGINSTYDDQMQLTEDLVRCVNHAMTDWMAMQPEFVVPSLYCVSEHPFERLKYDTTFSMTGADSVLNLSLPQLRQMVRQHTTVSSDVGDMNDRDDLLNLLLAECVEPQLGDQRPQFLCDYPISQAALAEQNPEDQRTACRFELYIAGMEICNGYQELTDADELQRRDQLQNQSRETHATATLPGAALLTQAMRSGLPKCSGVALGFDRLLMSLTGIHEIRQVIPFPAERA